MPGSARAAFAYPDFRRMWVGSFASNIGTWMQNVVLPAYVYQRTGKASVVALVSFAQLGPLLLLSIPAGVIADRFDRRRWLIAMQFVQLIFSAALAPLAAATPRCRGCSSSPSASAAATRSTPRRGRRCCRPSCAGPTCSGRSRSTRR